ncbi:MAG: PAS domain S-box protein [Xanthomonadales bacterium]|nr:PAS domain S-box protein [Xanthomonadales bacterium]
MFLRTDRQEKRLAAFNAPSRFAAVIGKCVTILILAIATVIVIGRNGHVFWPPLIALLLTALVAGVLVSLRPRLFLAPLGEAELRDAPTPQSDVGEEPMFMASPAPALLVDCESLAIIAANPAAEEVYGYSPIALCRLSLNTLLSASAKLDQTKVDTLAAGLARHQRADGSAFWAELQVSRIEHDARPAWFVIVTDVSARMNLAQQLESSERFALTLVELSLGIVFSHDLDGTLKMVNPAFAQALAMSKEELIGRNLAEFLLPRQRDAFSGYRSGVEHDEGGTGIIHLHKRDGGELVWEFHNRLRIGADGSKSVLCCAVDISERSRNERRLLEARHKDPLTGCYNRSHLQVFEEHAEPAACWAAIVIDIDHLKRCNETHGHRVGDQAIVGTARLLEGMVRSDDSVVRLGGDQFAILLRRCDQATLESFALRLQSTRENQPGAAFTFGMAMRKDGEDLEQTIRRADRQLIERRVIERSSIRLDLPREPRRAEYRRPLVRLHPALGNSEPECVRAGAIESEG